MKLIEGGRVEVMINGDTSLMGMIGNPVRQSLSPVLHTLTMEKMGINGVYLVFKVEPDQVEAAVASVRALNMIGINVTKPYKQEVIKYLDKLSPEAEACQSVNVIKNENGTLVGYNTDGRGFLDGIINENVDVADKNILMIGAGGAAYSIAYELAISGVKGINIIARDMSKSRKMASMVNAVKSGVAMGYKLNDEEFEELSEQADIIINCTPLGMKPDIDRAPISTLKKVKPSAVVCDIIYNPSVTKFLAMAQERNLKTINGLPMLLYQGRLFLKTLTGKEPPISFMKEVLQDSLQKL